MKVGIPTEVENGERRVATSPEAVVRLTELGFEVAVQSGAGDGCGMPDTMLAEAGAEIVSDAATLWSSADLVIKVNQDDLQVASRFASAWVERIDQEAVLKVRVSDHVERGGCMIEGGEENVDARFESQLDIMQQALRAQVEDTYESDSAGDSVADTGEAAVDTADSADEPTVDEPESES